jgi:hypothetical protein
VQYFAEAAELYQKDNSMSKSTTCYGKAAELSARSDDNAVAVEMFKKVCAHRDYFKTQRKKKKNFTKIPYSLVLIM